MAEESSGGQERTEEPTPKKLLDAKRKGQIARSRDFNTLLGLMFAGIGMLILGSQMGDGLSQLMRDTFVISREHAFDHKHMIHAVMSHIVDAIFIILPFMLLMVLAAFAGPLLLGGWSFSAKAMAPKFDKLNPLKGLKRVFGMNGLVELVKALLKFVLLGSIAIFTFDTIADDYLHLSQLPIREAIDQGASLVIWQFIMISAGLIIVAGIDVPYQLFTHKKKLMMTRQEIREENKETDGNPEMKGHRRQMQMEIAQGRMLQEVPNANVILVNPTHFAVALKYEEDGDSAPTVIAKGTDLIALKIRELADASNVPIFEAPPLARAIYYTTEINTEIPADLFLAVARVLAYVYQLNTATAAERRHLERPEDLPIPDEYKDLTRKQPHAQPRTQP
ncbi:MAG: flagellar biosynthesis protein FlhB [bacterium]